MTTRRPALINSSVPISQDTLSNGADTLLSAAGNDTVSASDVDPFVVSSIVTPLEQMAEGLPDAVQITAENELASMPEVTQSLADSQALIEATEQAALAPIEACINECRISIGTCEACIKGYAESAADYAEEVLTKATAKVDKTLTAAVSDSFAATTQLGLDPPGSEELQAILDGGGFPEQQVSLASQTPVAIGPEGITSLEQTAAAVFPGTISTNGTTTGATSLPPVMPPPAGTLPPQPVPAGITPHYDCDVIPTERVYDLSTINALLQIAATQNIPNQMVWYENVYVAFDDNGVIFSVVTPLGREGTSRLGSYADFKTSSACTGQPPPTPEPTPTPTQPNCIPICGMPPPSPPPECPPCETPPEPEPPLPRDGGLEEDKPQRRPPDRQGILGCDPKDREKVQEKIGEPATPPPPLPTFDPSIQSKQPLPPVQGYTVESHLRAQEGTDELVKIYSYKKVEDSVAEKAAKAVFSTVVGLINTGVSAAINYTIDTFLLPTFPDKECAIKATRPDLLENLVTNLIQTWTNSVPPQIMEQQRQRINFRCQYVIPSPADANAMYVRHALTKDEWEFSHKLNGVCIPWQEKLIDIQKAKPAISDAYRLWKLGKIPEFEFRRIWELNAIDTDNDEQLWKDTLAQIPSLSDLVRMMVRDVEDQTAVTDNDLDCDFDKKFKDTLRQWAESQGINEDVMKYFWRAHWQLPSPGQFYQMLHRFRDDDRDPDDKFKKITVTQEQVKKAIEQNDMAPRWVDALMGLSYSPLTRVDLRRAFEIGEIQEPELRRGYRDIGYDARRAEILTEFAKVESGPKRAAREGALKRNEIERAYTEGILSDSESLSSLRILYPKGDTAQRILESLGARKEIITRRNVIAAYKPRYMSGEFEDADIISQLMFAGLDQTNAGAIVQRWRSIRDAKYKAPTVSQLCDWWRRGLISIDEYMRRAKNLGYSSEDANRIIQTCVGKRQEQLAKEAEKAAKTAAAAAEKRRKEQERRAKEAMPCRVVKPKCPPLTPIGSNGAKS